MNEKYSMIVYTIAGLFSIAIGIFIWDSNTPTASIGLITPGLLVILGGWFFSHLQSTIKELENKQPDQVKLQEEYETLHQEFQALRTNYQELEALADTFVVTRVPKVCSIGESDELFSDRIPPLSPDHLYVIQQLFLRTSRIYIKPLEGGYSNFGVYKVIPENPLGKFLSGRVVKFLNYRDVRKEIKIHTEQTSILKKYPLSFTPGVPFNHWPSENESEFADKNQLGAVAYNLAQLDENNHLYTLGTLYKHLPFDMFKQYLDLLFKKLDWHSQRLGSLNGDGSPHLGGTDGIYERLYRKLNDIERCIKELIGIDFNFEDQEWTSLPFLSENERPWGIGNPVWWVNNIFVSAKASCFQALVHFSPVHGDLHTGNVLVETRQTVSELIQHVDKESSQARNLWLIDFPNADTGPVIQDIATLEADVKFSLIDMEKCTLEEWLEFEEILMKPLLEGGGLGLNWPFFQTWRPTNKELIKAWAFIEYLRHRVVRNDFMGANVQAYYLALLHETLPIVYRDKYTERQKQCALISSAWMCHYLI